MGFTDGGLVEPLILLLFLAALVGIATWLAVDRVRLLAARRHRITAPVSQLKAARTALEEVIADPFMNKSTRDRAIAARDAIQDIIHQNRELQ